ncbi:MAG: prolipoprotein diacylglyceryl transferase [Actinomycetaceae bacterium]|nr:prolipoprotein diacylglyceryl transferase [Actinomycetaceae bacterium]
MVFPALTMSIPSPPVSVWHIGPFPVRAYALAIICGIILAWYILSRRYRTKGGDADVCIDIAVWAVVFGIIGARLYHVATDWQLYFGQGRNPVDAFKIWNGGLGIWGGVAAGALGAYIAARRNNLRLAPIGDALVPGLLLAQAIGRFGNYFNQELYGKPTDVPWALEIDAAHLTGGYPVGTTFHPTFLYETLWCLLGIAVLLWCEKRFSLIGGQLFAAYLIWYTAGRFWIESLRIDSAHHILGLRLNMWTSIIIFIGACILFVYLRKRVQNDPHANDIYRDDESRHREESR